MPHGHHKFRARRERCIPEIRGVLDFLITEAEHAGPHVESPRFDAKGKGITYSAAGKPFCRFDPKHRAHRVWAWIRGADPIALEAAGAVPNRKHGPWVSVTNVGSAMKLVPEIRSAYARSVGNEGR